MNSRRYTEYKCSGVDWIGDIPSHWGIRRFKHLFQIKKEIVGELGYEVLSITQKGIKVKDIHSGEGQLSSDYSKYQKVNIGDFAMNHMDLLTGFVDISKYKGVTSPDYRVFRMTEKEGYDRYFLYLLQLCYSHKIFFPYGQGAAQVGRWRLPADAFKEFYAPIPTKEEQIAIVEFLDHEMSRIDSLINQCHKLISLLAEKRKSLIHDAVNHSKTRRIRLQYCVDNISRPINRDESTYYEPLGLYNRGRGIFHKNKKQGKDLGDSTFYYVEDGDLVISGQFAWEGAVALAGPDETGCVVSHRYPVLRGNNGLDTTFLWAFFTTHEGDFILNQHSNGAAGRNRPLNINTLLKEKVPVPLEGLQTPVLKIVQKEIALREEVKRIEKLLREHRISLINSLVTGKIDVSCDFKKAV